MDFANLGIFIPMFTLPDDSDDTFDIFSDNSSIQFFRDMIAQVEDEDTATSKRRCVSRDREKGSMSEATVTKSMESKQPVTLSGTAKDAKLAPPLGLVDIGESKRAYIFRVSLPGVCKPQCNVKLDIRVDGRVEIKGLMQDSEFISNHANKYKPRVQQLAPSGNFNVSFNLPGRVDPRLVEPTFRKSGILEVVVMKQTIPNNQPSNLATPGLAS